MADLNTFYTKHYGEGIKCPKCGHEAVRADKCKHCGAVSPMERGGTNCPKCGKPLAT